MRLTCTTICHAWRLAHPPPMDDGTNRGILFFASFVHTTYTYTGVSGVTPPVYKPGQTRPIIHGRRVCQPPSMADSRA
eukprot:4490399-Pyramimonas_sp.AAC.1